VSTCDRVSRSFVAFSSVDGWLNSDSADTFTDLISSARRNRGFGDAWGHVLVARGAADVMMEQELSTWDWAAFKIVVEEAGGRVTTLEGAEPFHGSSILTTNGLIHEEVLARMRGPVKRY
jgi:histidinol-phosphatase